MTRFTPRLWTTAVRHYSKGVTYPLFQGKIWEHILIPGSEARHPPPLGGVPCASLAPESIPASTDHKIFRRLRRLFLTMFQKHQIQFLPSTDTSNVLFSWCIIYPNVRRKKEEIIQYSGRESWRVVVKMKPNWAGANCVKRRMNNRMAQSWRRNRLLEFISDGKSKSEINIKSKNSHPVNRIDSHDIG